MGRGLFGMGEGQWKHEVGEMEVRKRKNKEDRDTGE